MIRVFDYLNASNYMNILADSGFHVQRNIINYILRKRDDFFFFLTVPIKEQDKVIPWFERHDRLKLIPINYSKAGSMNKIYLNIEGIRKRFKWRYYPLTVLWNNEAYLAVTMLQLFRATLPYAKVAQANYIHWLEIPEQNKLGGQFTANWHLWMLAAGIYWSDMTFINSQYGLETIKQFFPLFCRGDIYEIILQKIRPLYLGINVEELDKFKTDEVYDRPTFIFNHRLNYYTGAGEVLRVACSLFNEGYRFRIILTSPSTATVKGVDYDHSKYKDFILRYPGGLPFPKYVEALWKSDAAIAWQGGRVSGEPLNHWSLALKEATACRSYPIVHPLGFYSEILPQKFLLPQKDPALLKEAMRRVIESPEHYRKLSAEPMNHVREKFDWRHRIDEWIKVYEDLHSISERRYGELTTITQERILREIREKGKFKWREVRGKYMKWGSQMRTSRMAPYFWMCKNFKETYEAEPTFYVGELEKWL